ncbi:hypothetical protein M2164_000279 [Streptomyces sp. SAI-208]|nr:hypothetical protein [Streptomyces sp. SAI-208]
MCWCTTPVAGASRRFTLCDGSPLTLDWAKAPPSPPSAMALLKRAFIDGLSDLGCAPLRRLSPLEGESGPERRDPASPQQPLWRGAESTVYWLVYCNGGVRSRRTTPQPPAPAQLRGESLSSDDIRRYSRKRSRAPLFELEHALRRFRSAGARVYAERQAASVNRTGGMDDRRQPAGGEVASPCAGGDPQAGRGATLTPNLVGGGNPLQGGWGAGQEDYPAPVRSRRGGSPGRGYLRTAQVRNEAEHAAWRGNPFQAEGHRCLRGAGPQALGVPAAPGTEGACGVGAEGGVGLGSTEPPFRDRITDEELT